MRQNNSKKQFCCCKLNYLVDCILSNLYLTHLLALVFLQRSIWARRCQIRYQHLFRIMTRAELSNFRKNIIESKYFLILSFEFKTLLSSSGWFLASFSGLIEEDAGILIQAIQKEIWSDSVWVIIRSIRFT